MSVSGTSKFEIDVAGIFYGRSTPLHPTRPHKAPTEGSLWCVFPFAYKPTIAWNSPTDPYFSHHPPWDLAALQSVGDLGQTTAWQPGVGITMGNGQQAHWDGNSWEAGPVPLPLATQVTVGNPGVFGPANHRDPVTKAELDTINGGATWVVTGRLGDYVRVGNQDYYWNGSAWIQGRAPEKTSTTATAGSPGSFDAKRPADLNELQALTPNPSTKWATGQYVTTADGMDYHWDGNSWQGGRVTAALATGVNAGTPGTFTPPGSRAPLTKAELDTIPGSQSAWVAGQYVSVAGSDYHWNGAQWAVGKAALPPGSADKIIAATPHAQAPAGALPSVTGRLPDMLAYFYAGGGLTLRWNRIGGATVTGLTIQIRDGNTNNVRWNVSVAAQSVDLTVNMVPANEPRDIDYFLLTFTYSDGSQGTLRANMPQAPLPTPPSDATLPGLTTLPGNWSSTPAPAAIPVAPGKTPNLIAYFSNKIKYTGSSPEPESLMLKWSKTTPAAASYTVEVRDGTNNNIRFSKVLAGTINTWEGGVWPNQNIRPGDYILVVAKFADGSTGTARADIK